MLSEDGTAPGVPSASALSFEELERAAEIEDMDPTVLNQIVSAHQVLLDHLEAVTIEATEASQAVYNSHAAYTASLQSHIYALTARAHRMGFTVAQLNSVLGTDRDDD